ncbi:MAG: hypothetical protein Q9183_006595, partial [Haloplaca sp. 2 TL-2023]
TFDIDEEKGLAQTQSALLRCRWFGHAMFRYALHHLRVTALVRFFNEPGTSDVRATCPPEALLGPGCPFTDTSSSAIAHLLEHSPSTPWKIEWTTTTTHRYCLNVATEGLWSIVISRIDGDDVTLDRESPLCKFEVAPGCRIPTKLLRGPWSRSKMDFLRMLIAAGAILDWDTSNNGEVADKGLREAIVQGNETVVRLLTQEWSKVAPEQRTTFPYIRGTRCAKCPITITIDHLRLAVLEGGCKEGVVKAVVVAITKLENTRVDTDPVIENWAVEKKARGDARGKWLLDYLAAERPKRTGWISRCGFSF